ncbi:MAG: DUF3352 domain-containing protein [Bacteroidales bacterium]
MTKLLRKQLIFLIIAFVLLLAILFFVFRDAHRDQISSLSFIPNKSALVLELKDQGLSFVEEIDNSKWLSEIRKIKGIDIGLDELKRVDSLIRNNKAYIQNPQKSLYLVVPHDSGDLKDFLLVFPFSIDKLNSKSLQYIQELFGGKKLEELTKNKRGFSFENSDGAKFFVKSLRGVTLVANSSKQIAYALKAQSENTSLKNDSLFMALRSTTGKNVAAHLYFQIPSLVKPLENFFSHSDKKFAQNISSLGRWVGTDVIIREREVLLSGFTNLDLSKEWLSVFNEQKAKASSVIKFLPFKTVSFLDFCFTDFNKVYSKFKELHKEKGSLDSFLKPQYAIEKRYGLNLANDFYRKVGGELGMSYTLNYSGKLFPVFFFKSSDNLGMRSNLQRIIMKTKRSEAKINYQDMVIYNLGISKFIPAVFGDLFSEIRNSYFVHIDDFVFFANSTEALKAFIDSYKNGKTLDLNPNFISFADNLSGKSNALFYLNIHNGIGLLKNVVSPDVKVKIDQNTDFLNSMEAVSFECSSGEKLWYTNISVKNNPDYKEEKSSAWIFSLKDDAKGRIYFVPNHQTNKNYVILFDRNNRMYYIDPYGSVLWEKQLDGPVISKVFSIDYYKNGKIQYLFNTADMFYLVDINGQDVDKYPISIKPRATNGVNVLDYNNDRDYRIVWSGEDKRVYNYDIKGNRIDGWKIPKLNNISTKQINHYVVGKKDFLVINEDNGFVQITDRRGKTRIRVKGDFEKAKNSNIYVNKTNSKGLFITTNSNGELVYLKSNGNTSTSSFGTYSPEHYFLYSDLDGKKGHDFIFIDKNRIVAFDRFKKKLFDVQFPVEKLFEPKICYLSNGKKYLGVISCDKQEVYLLDKKGNVYQGKGFEGDISFSMGYLDSKQTNHLLTSKGDKLYNYIIR